MTKSEVAALIAALCFAVPAAADEQAESQPPRLVREAIDGERGSDEVTTERRDVPDYDGRPDAKPSAGERALWIPRVLLAPVYVVNEYLLRRPIGAMALWGEQNHVGAKVANFFTFGTGGKLGVLPTAMLDFGLRPSVGLYLFASDVPTDDDRFGVHFAYGGDDWWRVSVRERLVLGGDSGVQNTALSATRLNLHFVFDHRPDHVIRGSEVGVDDDDLYAFERIRLGGDANAEIVFGDLDAIEVGARAHRNRFDDGDGSVGKAEGSVFDLFSGASDPRDEADTALPGFAGYLATVGSVALNLDSRDPDPTHAGSGVRVRAWTDVGGDASRSDVLWANWGTTLGLFGDVNGMRRVLSLNLRVQLNEELGDEPTPFTELPTLGGTDGLRGFVEGEIRARSTSLAALQYTYPVWVFMDGFVFYEVGNGFGEHLDGFSFDRLASSFGIGVRSNADRDAAFSMLLAAGTTPFDAESYGVESVRLLIGTARGF